MALVKQTEGKGSHTLVTFTVENHAVSNESEVVLLGDFNNWETSDKAYQLKKDGDVYVTSLKLKNGKRYEFRYLSKGEVWFNDNAADDYVPSPYYGIDNSVVDLSTVVVKKKEVKKTTKKTATIKKKGNDLKKIEGIGPKIASVLAEKGIDTFEKLSEASVDKIVEILKDAGTRFSMHKPNSWPKQAKLAFEEKWDKLKKLQDTLKGGK
ncbi:helix-hairpin-helix domain-containing protein [Tenacibaculum agarivorans]|uniref:helix-hairpin-helix domain-containing protein n=1 Tax=Tenacibaculum agarivorans TaxID=1908389 RepID=UPI00094B9008|nr:helix-hairpin-helix domain-containing protein [Tenacibaculum agarivorans]